MSPMTLEAALSGLRRRFVEAGLAEAALDARLLVQGLLGLNSTDLVVDARRILTAPEVERLEEAAARRIAREPVHRILGFRDFYGVTLKLSPATLEPRPDTEILVDEALPRLRRMAGRGEAVRLLDMGTGTGAIAIALLKECPEANAVVTDISQDALAMARANADLNGVGERLFTCQSDWYENVTGNFDMILSNPPYIKTEVIEDLEPEVTLHDPLAALDGGKDGLDAYRAIAAGAKAYLKPEGFIGLEIGYDQNQSVTEIFREQGFVLDTAAKDHGGNDRVLILRCFEG
ncbi:peptide chain release factor N(5)-glutamine methyltransferase [Rhizobium paknamense]|uniref:Release factor glutamine methyltransferase n=1 Tax=Rhizobium paknamense TaxID=1206817 RepID=A0ABU0IJM1_9HYPH|nr:peptide chain release factor N(5)-glutamine methyltransferase [Rhizobium paknamense]MDQ0458460.1 release factor glutamine methyltransferase [Rhizobium paknamense]